MSTYNLSKTIHNIWLQQSRKRGACLYVATSNDYFSSFRQLHCTILSYMAIVWGLVYIRMNCDYVGLTNMVIHCKWLLQLLDYLHVPHIH